jgi:predicted DNA-binding transcriptional regulator AlpA
MQTTVTLPALMSPKEAAAYLGVSAKFLENDRWMGPKIPFVRVGPRCVRYRAQDLDEYIESRFQPAIAAE